MLQVSEAGALDRGLHRGRGDRLRQPLQPPRDHAEGDGGAGVARRRGVRRDHQRGEVKVQ